MTPLSEIEIQEINVKFFKMTLQCSGGVFWQLSLDGDL